jgi:hypothetical protein
MKNIHVLPTEKPSRLCYDRDDNLLFAPNAGFTYGDGKQHLYITSDEKLPYDSSIFNSGAFYHRDPVGDVHIITKHTFKPNPHFCKRIILTTDQDLISDGVQSIDDEFLEWFVKNHSCESVEVVHHEVSLVIDDTIYKIIIPQEEPKQETFEEAVVNSWLNYEHVEGCLYSTSYRAGFEAGAEWQAERMYSEGEVYELLFKLACEVVQDYDYTPKKLDKWFEQFKKTKDGK